MKQTWLLIPLVAATLTACPTETKPETLFIPANAWNGDLPADAQTISPEEFRQKINSGELSLVSTASLEAQRQAREKQYQDDKTFLKGIANPDPNLRALLSEADASPSFQGDRPVTLPDGQTVIVEGLGTQLRNAAETYKRGQSVGNALANYTLSYSLLPADLKAQLPTPDSLKGKPLAEVMAALKLLNDLLGTKPAILGRARLETFPRAPERAQISINPGNGKDNDGACTATNYAAKYWFPLKHFVSPVKQQANRGTCWAFTAIGAVESRERVQNSNPTDLSEQFLVNKVKQDWDSDDNSDGYWSEKALEKAVDKGQSFPPESAWTYNPAWNRPNVKDGDSNSYNNACMGYNGTCSQTAHQSRRVCSTFLGFNVCGYATVTFGGPGVASSETVQVWENGDDFDLGIYRLLLANGHVLMASFPVYKGFMDDVTANGTVKNYAKTKLENGKEVEGSYGGHAVQIVGFLSNSDLQPNPNAGGGGYFIIKNSWGCGRGDGGYYYIPADYVSSIFKKLSVLSFDNRRSNAWNQEQSLPGSSIPPTVTIKNNPASVDLRVQTDVAKFFNVAHSESTVQSVNLSVTSDKDGSLYNGPWAVGNGQLIPVLNYTFKTLGTRTLTLVAQHGSSQATTSFAVNAVNTPPSLGLQYSGDAHQGDAYIINAVIADKNEPNPSKLCANTTWSVDVPDTLSATTGCQVKVTFGATGFRQVRATTQDGEGATASTSATLNVLAPLPNPYPRITTYGVYSREIVKGPISSFCGSAAVSSGSTLDLKELGCDLVPNNFPPRYYAGVTVENPTNEVLSYDWTLYFTGNGGEFVLASAKASSKPSFNLSSGGDVAIPGACRVTLTVNAPDPSRSKSVNVWSGQCVRYATLQ